MNINSTKFGIASGLTASILWLICSVIVMVAPAMMLSVTGDMMHMQFNDMGWNLTLYGVCIGLIAWFAVASISAWLLATIYNKLQ